MSILSLMLLVITLISLGFAGYFWYKSQSYTRERFAFSAIIFVLSSIGFLISLQQPIGNIYQILSILILPVVCLLLFWIYKNWPNSKVIPENDHKLSYWYLRVSELWNLNYPEYEFFKDNWHKKLNCWIVKRNHSVKYLVLVCLTADNEENFSVSNLISYIEKQPFTKVNIRIVIVLEKKTMPIGLKILLGYKIEYFTEAELLDDLVNFDSYFNHIKRSVSEKFTGLYLSLEQMYTASNFRLEDGVLQENIEGYIFEWLTENSQRHLVILGEYGYGKTALVQMLAHGLLQVYRQNKSVRIPIIIELRGKSPRNLSPEEIFGTWKQGFGINPRAMMQLSLAGRLLIIFDGFDEMDLAINKDLRLQHFKSLWLFTHDKAKVLFTGRSHLFFNTEDLQHTQPFWQFSKTKPYCKMIHLEQFNMVQIKACLRHLTTLQANTQQEILELAQTNPRFFEMVSRPAILRMIASIWKNLPQNKEKINAAYIIDLLIHKTIELQLMTELSNTSDITRLNSAERRYFLQGIAVYMAVKGFPNQITKLDLEQVIYKLVQYIPEKALYTTLFNFELNQYSPLKRRLDFKQHQNKAIESILMDIQVDDLFVPDLTKPNTFKFAHKLFMELLAAKTYADWFVWTKLSIDEKRVAKSLKQAFKLTKTDIIQSKEMRAFFIERLVIHLQNTDISKQQYISKRLLRKLIPSFYWIQKPFLWIASNFGERFNSYKNSNLQQVLLLIVSVFSELILVVAAGGLIYKLIGIIPAILILTGVILSIMLGIGTLTGMILFYIGLIIMGGGWLSFKQLGIFGLLLFFVLQIVSLLRGFEVGLFWGRKSQQLNSLWTNYALWYETCTALGIDRDTMAKVVGKRAMILFEDPPEKKD